MKEKRFKTIIFFSSIGYVIGCVTLFLIALAIIFMAIKSIILDITSGSFSVYELLDEVGLLVFSIAVIDVAKYLMVEEVLRQSEKREPKEERRTLTKFVVIIATALSLEGLVLTIETAKDQIEKMLYPVALLITAMILIVGLGVYQKLNASSEDEKSK